MLEASREHNANVNLEHGLESGNVVVALIPKDKGQGRVAMVALTMSVWTNVSKPKLATSAVSLEQCVAMRVVAMERDVLETNRRTSFIRGNTNCFFILLFFIVADNWMVDMGWEGLDRDGQGVILGKYNCYWLLIPV